MAEPVKPRRSYHSPRRQQQAAATRQAILEAAQRLFERRGYPATTMEQVAAEAGVALKTVYLAFTTKSGLLRALWDLRLKGDQAEAAVAERPWYREVVEEPDPERQLRGNARNARLVKERIAGVLKILRSAAPVDSSTAGSLSVAIAGSVFGAWGMNFERIPLSAAPYGFWAVLAGTVALIVAALTMSWKRGWL